jgi:hypothetical protein
MIRQSFNRSKQRQHTSLCFKIQQGTTYQSQMPLSRLQIPARKKFKEGLDCSFKSSIKTT